MTLDQMVEHMRKAIDASETIRTSSWGGRSNPFLATDARFIVIDNASGIRYHVQVTDEPYIRDARAYRDHGGGYD
jgi:hypothetical protein